MTDDQPVTPYSDREIDIATRQAMATLLWQAGEITDAEGNPVGPMWDSRYDIDDFPEHQVANMRKKIAAFMETNLDDLVRSGHVIGWQDDRASVAMIGHDYVLTTGGHGAGFWDRGLGERGARLTAACEAERAEWYLSAADDWDGGEPGKVYCQELED